MAEYVYKPARVVDSASGVYVIYYALDEKGEPQRHRKRCNLKGYSKAQRLQYAQALAAQINEQLTKQGGLSEPLEEYEPIPINLLISRWLDHLQSTVKTRSYSQYKSNTSRFIKWVEAQEIGDNLSTHFSKKLTYKYLDFIAEKEGAKLYNAQIRHLSMLFTWAKKRGHVRENYFTNADKRRIPQKQAPVFSSHQREAIFSLARSEHPGFFTACLLCYYGFMRPDEICQIRIEHLDLDTGILRVPAESAKTDIFRKVVLNNTVLKALNHHLETYTRDYGQPPAPERIFAIHYAKASPYCLFAWIPTPGQSDAQRLLSKDFGAPADRSRSRI